MTAIGVKVAERGLLGLVTGHLRHDRRNMRDELRANELVQVKRFSHRLLRELHSRKPQDMAASACMAGVAFVRCRHVVRGPERVDRSVGRCGMVLTGAAAVRLSSIGWLRLKMPVSFVRLDFPARAQVAETALGNLELGLEHPVQLRPSTRLGLLAAFVAPSAEHGSQVALLNNRVLALGSALNGGKDSTLLTPGVTGLRLGAGVEHSLPPFGFRASLDVPLLVRVSDATLPEATETHPIGILPAIELKASWWITSWFGASLGASLITEPLRVQEPALERDRKQRLQPVVEPGLHVQLGEHVTLGLDGSVPVGGSLGGNAWSIGTHARFGL